MDSFTILMYYDVTMTMICLIVALLNIFIIKMVSEKNENDNKAMSRDAGKLQGSTVAGVSMIETIKSSGCEAGYFQKWIGYQTKFSNAVQRITERNTCIGAIPTLLQGLANTAILLLGVYNILIGRFTIGSLMAFQGFMSSFLSPVNSLVGIGQTIQSVSGDMERVEDVMNYEPDVYIDLNNEPDSKTEYKKAGRLRRYTEFNLCI